MHSFKIASKHFNAPRRDLFVGQNYILVRHRAAAAALWRTGMRPHTGEQIFAIKMILNRLLMDYINKYIRFAYTAQHFEYTRV